MHGGLSEGPRSVAGLERSVKPSCGIVTILRLPMCGYRAPTVGSAPIRASRWLPQIERPIKWLGNMPDKTIDVAVPRTERQAGEPPPNSPYPLLPFGFQ